MNASSNESIKQLSVADLMNPNVISMGPDATLQQAIEMMVKRGIRHLPIVDAGKVVGVISDRNVRLMVTDMVDVAERKRYLETTPVMNHASSPVSTTKTSTAVTEVARKFLEDRIGCLPVVDENDRLVGIITQTDLLKCLVDC
jgi:acetoin utilization protein AcuB